MHLGCPSSSLEKMWMLARAQISAKTFELSGLGVAAYYAPKEALTSKVGPHHFICSVRCVPQVTGNDRSSSEAYGYVTCRWRTRSAIAEEYGQGPLECLEIACPRQETCG